MNIYIRYVYKKMKSKYIIRGKKWPSSDGTKGTIINTIINSWLTFLFIDMTWLDIDGQFDLLSWVSTLEIITIFIMKPSYLKKYDMHVKILIILNIKRSSLKLSDYLLFKIIVFCIFKINILMTVYL